VKQGGNEVRSIQYQIACVRHVLAGSAVAPDIECGVEQAIKSLQWIDDNASLIRAAYGVFRSAPDIIFAIEEVMTTFPIVTPRVNHEAKT